MKDIHSHLLYGIDDGSKSIEESISLLKEMEYAGTTDLILTPHYVNHSKYDCDNKSKEELLKELKKKAKEENININLYLGNEVFFSNHFLELLKDKKIRTLNNSKYLLFEFPMSNVYNNSLEIINELVSKGYVPVLAHPERYYVFQKNPDSLEVYLQAGVLMQGNLTSLFGKYGHTPKKLLKYYLKKGWITFLGSDTHHEVKYNEEKLRKKLLKYTKDSNYTEDLLNNNFDKIINNEDIEMIK